MTGQVSLSRSLRGPSVDSDAFAVTQFLLDLTIIVESIGNGSSMAPYGCRAVAHTNLVKHCLFTLAMADMGLLRPQHTSRCRTLFTALATALRTVRGVGSVHSDVDLEGKAIASTCLQLLERDGSWSEGTLDSLVGDDLVDVLACVCDASIDTAARSKRVQQLVHPNRQRSVDESVDVTFPEPQVEAS